MRKEPRRRLSEDSLAALAELARILGGSPAAVKRFFDPGLAPPRQRIPPRRLRKKVARALRSAKRKPS